MKRIVAILALWLCAATLCAAQSMEEGPDLRHADVNLGNKTTLQRGARLFVNYCLSCHSAQYMRYSRMADDLGLDKDEVTRNLMFTTSKIGDTMKVAMRPNDAEKWFGVAPPDLSVIARAKGADWLYSYLTSFYLDDKRPTGVNNVYFPKTAMPDVLWELQGLRKLVPEKEGATEEGEGGHGPKFETVLPGKMTEAEYDRAMQDLVSFLVYMGEPAKLVRYRVGFWVIAFLLVLFLVTWLTKREYWKDVH